MRSYPATTHSFMENMKELLVHHFNMSSAMTREAAAQGFGLPDPWRYAHPYPGSTNVILNLGDKERTTVEKETTTTTDNTPAPSPAPQPSPRPRRGWWKWLWPVLLALLLLAMLGTILWLWLGQTAGGGHEHDDVNMIYEVYERTGDEPWKKSSLTVEQLLGTKKK